MGPGPSERMKITYGVAPAKAAAHCGSGERGISAFAGMTSAGVIFGGEPGDEEFRIVLKLLRARFLAGLGMTVARKSSHRLSSRVSC